MLLSIKALLDVAKTCVNIEEKYSIVTKPAEAASARLLLAAVLVEIDEKYPSDFSEGAGAPSRLTLRLDSSSF